MLIEQVRKLTPKERLYYWIRERHDIYLLKESGVGRPWTDDTVLQSYFFTNPYRENDRTTVWFRENIRGPLSTSPEVLMATVIFRWFNRVTTGQILLGHNLLVQWDCKRATSVLEACRDEGLKVFTGAYMIKAGNGPPGCKVSNVCAAISRVWERRDELVELCEYDCRLEAIWRRLKSFQYLGPFMSYEIVCDLRYTDLLNGALDILTWANPGPGALRGLMWLEGKTPAKRKVRVSNPITKMRKLLVDVQDRLSDMPEFELRTVEHSLCESDKYNRALFNSGKMKRNYNGKG